MKPKTEIKMLRFLINAIKEDFVGIAEMCNNLKTIQYIDPNMLDNILDAAQAATNFLDRGLATIDMPDKETMN